MDDFDDVDTDDDACTRTAASGASGDSPRSRDHRPNHAYTNAAQQLLKFLDLHPQLKKPIGGLIVRFHDSRSLSRGPITETLMAPLMEKMHDLSLVVTREGLNHGPPPPPVRDCLLESIDRITHPQNRSICAYTCSSTVPLRYQIAVSLSCVPSPERA